jgi:acyl-CoA thioesterase FadM
MPQEPDFSRFQPMTHDTTGVSGVIAVTLPVLKASAAYLAEVVCEDASIRYWKDESGVDPDATHGILAGAGERFYLWTVEITHFRAIAIGDPAKLQTTFYVQRIGKRNLEPA